MKFIKATKAKSKLRLAIFGPSGSGKTFSALRIAKGIGGTIALIDTERSTASKYADRFDFDALDLPMPDVPTYVKGIDAAVGYDVLIIDSLSHAWQHLLQEVEKLAKAKYRGNTWSAWSEGTPIQKRLVNALLDFPGHIIVTMRSKTEWSVEKTEGGSSKPTRVGLAPEQGKGIEYEFDLLMELSVEHLAHIIKDRTGKFQDAMFDKPDEAFGASLAEWLNDGVEVPKQQLTPPEAVADAKFKKQAGAFIKALGLDKEAFERFKMKCEEHGKQWESVALQAEAEECITIEGLYALIEPSQQTLPTDPAGATK